MLEALLKVIVTPVVSPPTNTQYDDADHGSQDPAEGFVLNYTLLIGDLSYSNFQKVWLLARRRSCAAFIISAVDPRLEGYTQTRPERSHGYFPHYYKHQTRTSSHVIPVNTRHGSWTR